MKLHVFFYFLIILFLNCSKFSEELDGDFLNYQEAMITDFNTKFPLINIEVDQKEFDEMYLNYTEEIEIEGFLNIFRNKEQVISNKLVEVQIKGTQSATFSLKSLGIKFDEIFDNREKKLLNPRTVLPQHHIEEIKAFRIRNSGNDFKKTLLKDVSYTQLAINAGLNLDLTYFEPSIVFVNGVFLGIMNLRSEGNTNGISRLNNVEKEDITLAKINYPGVIEKKDGDFDRIDALMEAIENDNLTHLINEIDLDNFIDYMIFHSYIANVDWPYNNVRFYAVKESKFRFIVYDLDWANTRKIDHHPLDFIINPTKYSPTEGIKNPITELFNILYQDASFKTQFDSRYLEVIDNKLLSSSKFNSIIHDNFTTIHQFFPMQIKKYSEINTMVEWYRNIELLKENFKEREQNILSFNPLF